MGLNVNVRRAIDTGDTFERARYVDSLAEVERVNVDADTDFGRNFSVEPDF